MKGTNLRRRMIHKVNESIREIKFRHRDKGTGTDLPPLKLEFYIMQLVGWYGYGIEPGSYSPIFV